MSPHINPLASPYQVFPDQGVGEAEMGQAQRVIRCVRLTSTTSTDSSKHKQSYCRKQQDKENPRMSGTLLFLYRTIQCVAFRKRNTVSPMQHTCNQDVTNPHSNRPTALASCRANRTDTDQNLRNCTSQAKFVPAGISKGG